MKWFGVYYNGVSRFDDEATVFVESENMPKVITLNNYPNPFNPFTTINYTLTEAGPVKLSIYNLTGQLIENLINEFKPAGLYTSTWRPENLSSGIYLYRLETNGYSSDGKMMIIK